MIPSGDHPHVVMIGGTGRSGSNLLKAALSQAADTVALPFETRFAVDPDGLLPALRALREPLTPFEGHLVVTRLERLLRRVAKRGPLDRIAMTAERSIRAAVAGPVNLRAYKEWELERHAPGFGAAVSELMAGLEVGRYGGVWPGRAGWRRARQNRIAVSDPVPPMSRFLGQVFGSITSRAGARTYIADETYSLFFAPEWQLLLPGIRFIHVVRDPRDVVASLMGQRWAPSDLTLALAFYKASIGPILNALEQVPAEAVVTVRLEDVLADPEAEYARLCPQVGLSFTPDMTQLDHSRGHRGRWRSDIPADEHAALCQSLAPELARFSYDPA